jgi:hypothetical protein
MNRNSRRGRMIGTREAQPKQFPQPSTPHKRWEFFAGESLRVLKLSNVHMKFSSFAPGYPVNCFVFLLSESFLIFNVICVFRDIDGSKERKERISLLSRSPRS